MNNYFYSASSGGFYIEDLHLDIPDDAVPVSAQTYNDLMTGQSQGFLIVADENGAPKLKTPDPPLAPEPETIITNLAFDLRFTQEERVAIELASLDDPTATLQQRTQAAALRVWKERANKAMFTDLANQTTRDSVFHLETAGLIDEGRALQILDSPILDEERP